MDTPVKNPNPIMSDEALAKLGAPQTVYIRTVTAGDLRSEIQGLDNIPDDLTLYSVHAADGTRMAVMDDHDAAVNAARENEMEPVSVH